MNLHRLSTEQGSEGMPPAQTQDHTARALHYVSKTLGDRLSHLARSNSVPDQWEALTAAVYLMSSAASPNFVSRESRRRSFEQNGVWSRQGGAQSVEDMVESGFFYMGEADHVKCFFCDLGLRDWEAGDVPEMEHAKFSPLCFFLKSSRGLDWLRRSSPRPPNYPTSYFRQDHNQLLRILAVEASEFQDVRMLGFCSTKILLCVARQFIRHVMLLDRKQLIHELLEDQGREPPVFNSAFDLVAALSSFCTRAMPDVERPEDLQKLSELCRRCRVRSREVVFRPCSHFVFCLQCSKAVRLCPVASCRQIIVRLQRAFIA